MSDQVRYDAFISYRHCGPDKEIAENLHKALENFRLPHALSKKVGKRKLERVFRDEAELAVSAELSEEIEKALLSSEYLIVVCTPRLQESEWCMKEIDTFLKISDRNHILLVLGEGEPEESFPEILTYEDVEKKTGDGQIFTVREKREPLAGDCRGETKKKRKEAFKNTVLRLCATMFGVRFDDLKQRQKERKMRTNAVVSGLIFLVVFCTAAQNTYFLIQTHNQNIIIMDKLATITASSSQELLNDGRRMDAMYAARSVLPDTDKEGYNEDAYRVLQDAMNLYMSPSIYVPEKTIPIYPDTGKLNADASLLLCYDSSCLYRVTEVKTGDEICNFEANAVTVVEFTGKNAILKYDGNKLVYLNPYTGEEKEIVVPKLDPEKDSYQICSVPDGSISEVVLNDAVYAVSDGEILYKLNKELLKIGKDEYISNLSFSEDGLYGVIGILEKDVYTHVRMIAFETESGKILARFDGDCENEEILSDVVPGEKGFFYLTTTDDNLSIIRFFDYKKNKITGEYKLTGEYYNNMSRIGDVIGVYSSEQIALFDTNLNLLAQRGNTGFPVGVLEYEGTFAYILPDGKMYLWDKEYQSFWTKNVFPQNVTFPNYLDSVEFRNDEFFVFREGKDYVTEYKPSRTECLTPTQEAEFDLKYYDNPWLDEFADEIARTENFEIASRAVSSDKKYAVVQSKDYQLWIYDVETKQQVRKLYAEEGDVLNFFYCQKADCYLIEFGGITNYGVGIFDNEFHYNAYIPQSYISGTVAGTDDPVIALSDYQDYMITPLSYEDVIKRADEELAGYTPDVKFLEKYGLN